MIAVLARFNVGEKPLGKQTYFFEEMLLTLPSLEAEKFIFVNPNDFDSKRLAFLQGYKFNVDTQEWYKESNVPLPHIAYDRYWSKNDYERASSRKVKETIRKLGGKVYNPPAITSFVYNKLELSNFLHKYQFPTPSTLLITSQEQLKKELLARKDGRFYLKPIYGAKGNKIVVIQKKETSFTMQDNHRWYHGLVPILNRISELRQSEEYIIQPEIPQPSGFDRPFDVRVLVNLVGNTYKITGMGVRCGSSEEYRSNLNLGGTAHSIAFFFHRHAKSIRERLKREISEVCLAIANTIQEQKGQFLELGFDVLLDRHYKPCVLEINSKPSRWIFVIVSKTSSESLTVRNLYSDLRKKSVHLPARTLIEIHDAME